MVAGCGAKCIDLVADTVTVTELDWVAKFDSYI